MAATQAHRKIQVFTALPEDTLLFYQMQGKEGLSELFEFKLELLSEKPDIEPESLLGESITIQMELDGGGWRYFNGYVSRFGHCGIVEEYYHYYTEVRPWLWFLTRASNCRIFQRKKVPDIIAQVFRDQGFSDFQNRLTGDYQPREYCVQYRETDFNFVSRLMEEEGIYYYFGHQENKHTLFLVDANTSLDEYAGYARIPYHVETSVVDRSRQDHIYDWRFAREVQTGRYELTDYDFTKPKANLLVKSKIEEAHAHASHEFFDYPGRYTEKGVGEAYVRYRIEELHARFDRSEGQANARGLAPGHLFTLQEHPRREQNKRYLILSVNYQLKSDEYFSSARAVDTKLFDCQFVAQDSVHPYRPPRLSSRPLVHGAQTAMVVGPAGEEIYTDKYGRVKVQFHWDRYGTKDENSSCWIRVAHPWAGKNWGMVAIPRIGHEVVVEFLEGDPDQPLIVGSVYNNDNMPPYMLPDNKTQTGILSRSSKGGSAANANELRFEDKKGSEQVYLHAEKNQDIEVENDETHWVGHDRTKTIDHDETTRVKHDRTETVDNNETITIGVNRTETVGSNEAIYIGLNRTRSVGVNEAIAIGAAQEIIVGAARTVTVGASQATTIGQSCSVDVGKNQSQTVGDNRSISIGKDDSLKVGKNLVIEAGDAITIKTGDASITLKKNGDITIKGKNITLNGSGKINIKASSDVVIKGSKISEN